MNTERGTKPLIMKRKLIIAVLIFGFGWGSSVTWSLISHEMALERRRGYASHVIERLHQKLSAYGTAFDNVGLAYSVMGDSLLHRAEVVVINGTVSSTKHMNILMHHVLESRFPAQTSFSVFVDSSPQVQPNRTLDEMFPVR